MQQLNFEDALRKEEVMKQVADVLRTLTITLGDLETEAHNCKDQGIKAGKLFAVSRIRDNLKNLPIL
jgi:hypothetical protein